MRPILSTLFRVRVQLTGSFRDLLFREVENSNSFGSVDVFVFQNDISLFSVDRENSPENAGRLTQADGTFSITGLSFAVGDTISFVVGNNGAVGGDESALQASVSIERSDVLLGDANCDGVIDFLDIVPFIELLSTGGFKAQADIDQNGEVDFLDIAPFISILNSL